MEKVLPESLPIISVGDVITSTIQFIDDRRKGNIKSLRTSFDKLNKCLLGGVDWWRILTIAGVPGGGKSTILSLIRKDFLELNKDQEFEILSFEFEMRLEDQLSRDISSSLSTDIKTLYSAEKSLEDDKFNEVKVLLDAKKDLPLFFVDRVGSVREIIQTIMGFANNRGLKENGKGLVVTIDHILLTKGKTGEGEKAKIDDLSHSLVELKKYFSSVGIKVIFIMLSQLNRDISEKERVSNPKLHYPTMNDLFAASSVYQCSDYVLVTQIPAKISGIGLFYGPPKEGFPAGLPVFCPKSPNTPMIYWHLIKERFGDQKIIPLIADFKHSKMEEYNL
jgi:hypothetical protein